MAKLDIISCEQSPTTLVSRSLIEDFYAKSVLIVDESQEAIFYKDGQALDLFPSGRHALDTNNLPLFKKIFAKLFNQDRTPFPCSVIFINKSCVMDVGWGTDTPVTVEDPKYHLIVHVRANGQMSFRVTDSRKFVVKLARNFGDYEVDTIKKAIKALIMASVKSNISSTITQEGVSVLEINNHLFNLSEGIRDKVNVEIEKYGIELDSLYVGAVNADDADLATLTEAKAQAIHMDIESEAMQRASMRETQAEAYKQQQLGYSYQEARTYDVLKSAAENTATGGAIMNAGVGIGMGVGMAGNFNNMVNNMSQNRQPLPNQGVPQQSLPPQGAAPQGQGLVCPTCQTPIPEGAKFCPGCGAKVEDMKPKASFCPNCGNKLEGNVKFCPNCGQKLQ